MIRVVLEVKVGDVLRVVDVELRQRAHDLGARDEARGVVHQALGGHPADLKEDHQTIQDE